MDYAAIHHEFEALLAEGQLDEAIELIVEVAERPDLHQETACSAINSLVFSALIPEKRFSESIAWLDDSIEGDYGYESWNSISNLGHVYLRLGQVERATSLFTTMIQSQFGPIDEAEEFLAMIASGDAASLDSKRPDPRETVAYRHLLGYLESTGENHELLEAFNTSRGGATHGFIQGVLTAEDIQNINPTNDAIAQALWDFITKEPANSGPTYDEAVQALTSGSATKAHARAIREAAFRATAGAASHMYTYVSENQGHSRPWRNVALARGEEIIQETSTLSTPATTTPPPPRSMRI